MALVVVTGVLLAGCGNAGEPGPDTGTAAVATNPSPTVSAEEAAPQAGRSDDHTLVTAGKTALGQLPDATVVGIESEDGGAYWEVKVAKPDGQRMKLHVSADGNRIERGPSKSGQSAKSKAKWRQRLDAATVDYADAYEKILAARHGRVTELELDDHHDVIVWEADVKVDGTKYKVRIDAGDGKVVSNKRD